jgi:phage gp36-like protein
MGRYINWADVTGRYVDFAKGPDALIAEAAFVPHAEAEVDARLAPKYSVPFSPAPYLVKDLSIDLAYYKATIKQESAKALKEYIDARFEAIIGGTLILTTSAGPVASLSGGGWASNSYHSSFGLDDDVNWHVDSTATYAQQSARGQVP